MDALSGLLDGPRARDAFLLRSVLEPPWSLRIQDDAPMAVVAVVSGTAWIVPDDGDRLELVAGDVVLVPRCGPYVVADAPDRQPDIVIHPGNRCTTLDGVDLHDVMALGIRTWGNSLTGSTVLLTGTYEVEGEVSRRLLAALPARPLIPHRGGGAVVELLAQEIAKDQPGQQVVLDRLLDLLLITSLRAWFDRPDVETPGWYSAASDPLVGPALRLLHDTPAQSWTVASLAREVGVSRATLARRFHDLVGQPPMRYLTEWRLALAADLLLDPAATVGSVARQVGYGSPYALSTAFKRERGLSPKAHRHAVMS